MADFLVPQERFLESGVHIGTRNKNGSMREYIYKTRDDGLHVLDLKKMDEKLRVASKLLATYEPGKVFAVGSKDNARKAIAKFCDLTGCSPLNGRFTPGRFTNPSRPDFCEPEIILVVDPGVDRQSVKEANTINVPIVALCDTNNSTRFVDLAIPTNNKGRKAIALMFWILAREILKAQGKITGDEEYKATPQDFEA
ncbi:MAG: 30S ribosomal protein S2 [Candidatus Micrarchaeia archaeon]|jgi:small subunit ribosomal protein S2